MGWMFRFVIGVVLLALGGFVAVYPLIKHGATVTPARWLDMAFAIVFLLRGVINVRSALRRRGGMSR